MFDFSKLKNDLSWETCLMANDYYDEAEKIRNALKRLETLEKRLELVEKIASDKSRFLCPFCKSELEPVEYQGYYDGFVYWGCDCEEFPNDVAKTKWKGAYA